LYNSIRDLKLHFPDSDIQVCIGVDKHNVMIKDWAAITDWQHFGTMTEVNIAPEYIEWELKHLWCSLSHLNVIKDALDKWYEKIMVAEDDLMLWTRAWDNFDKFYNNLPEDREIARLSWFPSNMESMTVKNNYRYNWNSVRWCELYIANKKWIKKLYDSFVKNFYASFDYQLWKWCWDIKCYVSKFPFWIQWNNYEMDSSDWTGNRKNKISESNKWWYIITGKKKYLTP
jgi:GR25 family glycosyltransferase involved in LPS biosynthesis